eukprot:2067886-Prymnesium_polylepis.2
MRVRPCALCAHVPSACGLHEAECPMIVSGVGWRAALDPAHHTARNADHGHCCSKLDCYALPGSGGADCPERSADERAICRETGSMVR